MQSLWGDGGLRVLCSVYVRIGVLVSPKQACIVLFEDYALVLYTELTNIRTHVDDVNAGEVTS